MPNFAARVSLSLPPIATGASTLRNIAPLIARCDAHLFPQVSIARPISEAPQFSILILRHLGKNLENSWKYRL